MQMEKIDVGPCICPNPIPSPRLPDVRNAMDVFIHETVIPASIFVFVILLALAVGAFALRGCRIEGLKSQNQLVHKVP